MKKVLSVLLVVCFMAGVLPMGASADSAFAKGGEPIDKIERVAQEAGQGHTLKSDAVLFAADNGAVATLVNYIKNDGMYHSGTGTKYYADTINTGEGKSIIVIQHYSSKGTLRFGVVNTLADNSELTVTFDYDIASKSVGSTGILVSCAVGGSEVIVQAPFNIGSYTANTALSYRKVSSSGILPDFSLVRELCDESVKLSLNVWQLSLLRKLGISLYDFGFVSYFNPPATKPEATAVTGVSLDKATLKLEQEETAYLTATVSPSTAANKDVTWSSSDASVAKVDPTGKVTAMSVGTATISATTVDGGYTAKCTVTVTSQGTVAPTKFVDVPANQYYAEAVKWAVENGITNGTDKTHFSPNASCTRAQAVTFLWNSAGKPEPQGGANPFTDVKSGSYYEKAVQWAVENNITGGTGKNTFSPNATCTRAQIVTFLYRAENSPETTGNVSFSDVPSGAYYKNAVKWAVENGITSGTGGNKFSPGNNCVRSQIVTFLYRYSK